jgi:DNA repair photolyase
MRWQTQTLGERDPVALPGLARLDGFVRTVTTPEFAGVRFHEVAARSALNAVPKASRMSFRWTINPYRGCTHACVYCFARNTHAYLDLDTGAGFDSDIVVKVNLPEVLRVELGRASWRREHVALGTNTDPYQRAEGRYRLMPAVIAALAAARTPFSILTKGTLIRRDLLALAGAATQVPVAVNVSIAIHDDALHRSLEPGAPSPQARLDAVRAIRAAGLPCGVMLAPVVPWLSDSVEHLDVALARVAAAGATGVAVIPLHLRPGAREWFLRWLGEQHPDLVPRYRRLYGGGSSVPASYRDWLQRRVEPLLRRHGLGPLRTMRSIPGDGPDGHEFDGPDREGSAGPEPRPAAGPVPSGAGAEALAAGQLRLL